MVWRVWIVAGLLMLLASNVDAAVPRVPLVGTAASELAKTAVADGAIPLARVLAGKAHFSAYNDALLRGRPLDVWLRLYIAPIATDQRSFLRLSAIDRADAYIPVRSGAYIHQRAGIDIPFERRTVPDALPTFLLTGVDDSTRPIYLHLRFHPAQRLRLRLQTAPQFYRGSVVRRFIQGTFLGVLLAVFLFNIYVFVALRARTALWYLAFVLALGLNEIVSTGIGAEYLWPVLGGHARLTNLVTSTLSYVTYLLFARAFLLVRRSFPVLDWCVIGLFSLEISVAIAQYALPVGRSLVTPLLACQFAAIIGLAFVGIARWRVGFEPARFFVIAFIPMALGVFANLLYNAFLPGDRWALAGYGVEIGAMFQAVVMSCSVLDRIQTIDRERRAVEVALSTQAQRNMELRTMALTDPLTGIANRLAFYDNVRGAIETARTEGNAVGVLFIDVDGFKRVNDAYGHSTGDELLRIVAQRLATVVRNDDLVARIGGDEFALLVREVADASDLEGAHARVLGAFVEPVAIDRRRLPIRLSVGIGWFPRDGNSVDEVIDAADRSMYQQKQRHTVEHATTQPLPDGGS